MLAECGVSGYRVVLDKRAQKRLGQCRYSLREIGLNARWVAQAPWLEVEQVVRHEAAHAFVGPGHGHDRVWKAAARRFGAPATYNFATTTPVRGSVDVVCERCGVVGTMFRMPKRTFGKYHLTCRQPVRFVRRKG